MSINRKFLFVFLVGLTVSVYAIPASALSLLFTADNLWFDPQDKTPVNAELEFQGLGIEQVQELISANKDKLPAGKLKVRTKVNARGETNVLIDATNIFHRDLVALKNFVEVMKKDGAVSARPEVPLVPRIFEMGKTPKRLKFAHEMSGLRMSDLKKIVKAEQQSAKNGKPVIFRYNLENMDKYFNEDAAELRAAYRQGHATLGQIPTGLIGRMPVMIDGEDSAVWHARWYHGNSIVADHNPALVNSLIQNLLINKWLESRFFGAHAPGVYPATDLLEKDIPPLGSNPTVEEVKQKAVQLKEIFNKRYPQGYVVKGTDESSTALFLITEKTDFGEAIEEYFHSDFDKREKEIRIEFDGADEDTVFEHLQEQKGYFGWKLTNYFKNPHTAIVQEKIDIDREFRTDVALGKVLRGPGMTIDRHFEKLVKRGDALVESTPEQFADAELWLQGMLSELKKQVPWVGSSSGGYDYARRKTKTPDGRNLYQMVESNMGVESSGWYDTVEQVEYINQLLAGYRKALKKGEIAKGMTPEAQMKVIFQLAKDLDIDLERFFPGFTLNEHGMFPSY